MKRNVLTISTILGLAISAPAFADPMELPMHTQSNIESAEAAIAACDEAAFNRAMNNLREQQESLESQSKQKPSEWNSAENIAQAGEYARNVDATRRVLQADWTMAQPCGEEAKEEAKTEYASPTIAGFSQSAYEDDDYDTALRYAGEFGAIRVAAGGGIIALPGRTGHVGTEVTGTPSTREQGVIKADSTGTISSYGLDFAIPLGPVPNWIPNAPNVPNVPNSGPFSFWDMFFGFDNTEANFTEISDRFETGGRDLLLTGVGAGPNASGFVVGAANSTITDISYNANYDFTSYELGFGKTLPSPNNDESVRFRPFGGLQYGHSESDETFRGITNAGTLPFFYHTTVDNKFWAPFIGVDISARPPVISNLLQTPIELTTTLKYSYVMNDGEGNDILNVTGFTPGVAPLSNDDNTHDFSAKVGFTIFPDAPFNFTIGGGYEHIGNIPQVTRDGVGLSQLKYEDANVWAAEARAKLRF